MNDHTDMSVENLLRKTDFARDRLILVVGPTSSGKTEWLRSTADSHRLRFLALGVPLAGALSELSVRQRPLAVARSIESILPDPKVGICLDNTDILFAPELECDPLRLFALLSQHRLVVASVTGSYSKGRFVRAYPSHPEYFSMDLVGHLVVSLDSGQASIFQT